MDGRCEFVFFIRVMHLSPSASATFTVTPCTIQSTGRLPLEAEQGSHKLRYGTPEPQKEEIQTTLTQTRSHVARDISFRDA